LYFFCGCVVAFVFVVCGLLFFHRSVFFLHSRFSAFFLVSGTGQWSCVFSRSVGLAKAG
jgi:hypothetical protein